MVNPDEILQQVADEVVVCPKCDLQFSRKNAVPGAGPSNAQVMLIGEAPGFYENEKGLPFVGPAGKFLDELIEKGGMKREDVFITNIVKCRPPGNRDPEQVELEACSNYLERQIAGINPLVIVTLGRYSMARYLPNAKISQVHGQRQWVKGRLIVTMYHPAAALHQPKLKDTLLQDFSHLSQWVKEAQQQRPADPTPEQEPETGDDAEQLSLF
jgi:uracil-DNA glycosylase family 4